MNYINKIFHINNLLNSDAGSVADEILKNFSCRDTKQFIFKTLAKRECAKNWFSFLLNNDLFSASQAYTIKQSQNDNSFYRWPALFYLEKVSILNKETENTDMSRELLTIINNVQDYYFKQNLEADNSLTWAYFLKILNNIPTQTILDFAAEKKIDNIAEAWFKRWIAKEGEFSVVFMELSSKILPHFLTGDQRGHLIAETILDLVTQIKWVDVKGEKRPVLMVRDYLLTTTFRDHLDAIVQKCSVNVVFQLADKLSALAKKYDKSDSSDKHSSLWLRQTDKRPKYPIRNEPYKLLAVFLKNSVIRACELDTKKGNEIISKFISQDYQSPFLRRVALFIISRNWNDYHASLENFLNMVDDPFENSSYEEEFDYLFRHQTNAILAASYLPKIKEQVKAAFQRIKKTNKEYWPYFQQKWAEPFKDKGGAFFREFYQESYAITKQDEMISVAQKRTRSVVRAGWHQFENVWSVEDILNKSIDLFIQHIKGLSQPQKSTLECMELENQLDPLRVAITENPDYFIHDLSKFLLLDTELPGFVLRGYREAINQKKIFEWDKVLSFCEDYLDELSKIDFNKEIHHVFFGNFSGLIEAASGNDHFEAKQHARIKKLFEKAFKIYPYDLPKEDGDHLTTTINTAYGRLCMAIFSFALHCARMLKEDNNSERISWFKDEYNNFLSKGILEAYLVFGQFLANFCYINQKWAHSKISEFKSLNDQRWQWWMEGYLNGEHVYTDLYKLSHPHYLRGINTQWKDRETKDCLTEHLGVGYLRLDESLTAEDSLFKSLLDSHDFDVYQKIIDFFWSHHEVVEKSYREGKTDGDIDRVKKLICAFSQWITDKEKIDIEKIFSENYPVLLSDLSRLVLFVDALDDKNIQWVLKSAPYVHENHHGYFFWQYLKRFTEDNQNAANLGDILKKSLEKLEYLSAEEKSDIRDIVDFIKENNLSESVRDICNTLAKRGFEEFALTLYNKD